MKKEELLEKLDQWTRRARRDEAPDNIIWHIDDDSAYQDIVALIKKPEVTEEWVAKRKLWVEKKATELLDITSDKDFSYSVRLGNAEDFIHSLVEEVIK